MSVCIQDKDSRENVIAKPCISTHYRLDAVRSHFGEHIALYFGFLNFYFQSLSSIAAIGLAFWFAGAPFHPIYSLLLVAWSCVFVELWRMRERKLAVRWGTLGVGQVDDRRKSFKPVSVRRDPVTGEDDEVFEWWRRELRIVTSVPVMLFFAAVLGATMTTMFATEVFVTKLYVSPSFLALLPRGRFCCSQAPAGRARQVDGSNDSYGPLCRLRSSDHGRLAGNCVCPHQLGGTSSLTPSSPLLHGMLTKRMIHRTTTASGRTSHR